MRTKKSFINVIYTFIFSLLNIFLGFFSRAVFLVVFSTEFLGLTTVVTNIIGVLSLMELGVASAIAYALYKHIKDENYTKINELMKFIRITYSIVGIALLLLGLVLMPFIHNIFNTSLDGTTVYTTYMLYLVATVISYFITYKQVLATADQNSHIITRLTGIIKLVKTIVQVIVILQFNSFFMWVILEMAGNIITYIFINRSISKKYTWLNTKIDKSYKTLIKENKDVLHNLKNIIFHRLATVILKQTDSIIISIYFSFTQVGLFSNYMLIVNQLQTFVGQVFSSFTASIGNLIATGDKRKSYDIFKQLFQLEFFIGLLLSYSLYKTVNPFIEVWIGREYWLSDAFVLILVLNFFIGTTRQTVGSFKNGYGIFWDIYAPVIEGMINIAVSIFLISKYGLVGLLIGTFISLILVIVLWQPYILFKQGFKQHYFNYIGLYLKSLTLGILSVLIVEWIINMINFNLSNQVLYFFILGFLSLSMISFIFGTLLFIASSPFREVLYRITNTLKLKVIGEKK